MLTKVAFIWSKIQYNINIVNYYYNLKQHFLYILKCNLFLWWQSWSFSIIISVFSVKMILQKSF